MHLLADLFLQDAGPNIRAQIVHGTVRNFNAIFEVVTVERPIKAVLACFLTLCTPWLRKDSSPPEARCVLETLAETVQRYSPCYQPDAILASHLSRCLSALQRFCTTLQAHLASAAIVEEPSKALDDAVKAVRSDLSHMALKGAASSASPFAALAAALPSDIVCPPKPVPDLAKLEHLASSWLSRMLRPDFVSMHTCVPLGLCIRGAVGSITEVCDALGSRLQTLDAKMKDRSARTAQRRLYAATLQTGPAFVEYLVVVMLALERHVIQTLSGAAGLSEERLGRISRFTESMALIGGCDKDRKGYDRALKELADFLKTRAAKEVLSA